MANSHDQANASRAWSETGQSAIAEGTGEALITSFTVYDKSILAGGLAMAAGTFMPIVSLPLVGSINYIAGGRGDGTIVLALSAAVVAAVIFGYRRMAAVMGGAALVVMVTTVLKLLEALSQIHGEVTKLGKDNPFGGLAVTLAHSVGLEWGWMPLIGGAIVIAGAGLMAPSGADSGSEQTKSDESSGASSRRTEESNVGLQDTDKIVARYLKEAEQRKPSVGSPAPATFGKRRDNGPTNP